MICCPEDEEDEIRRILGDTADQVDYIRAWREYDDITNYLRRQQPVWEAQSRQVQQAQSPEEAAPRLRDLIQEYTTALNSLNSYNEFIYHLNDEMQRLTQERDRLTEELEALQAQLNEIEEQAEGPQEERPVQVL